VSAIPHESATAHALRQRASDRASGRLAVGAGAGEIAIYLLEGQLIAITAGDDVRHLLSRFKATGHLPKARAQQLHALLDAPETSGQDILSLLSEAVPTPVFDGILRQRFDENLSRFLGHRGTPSAYPDAVAWATNILIGEPTSRRVDRCHRAWRLAMSFNDKMLLTAGTKPPQHRVEEHALRIVSERPRTAGDVANELDMEHVASRTAVLNMLDRGVLTKHTPAIQAAREANVSDTLAGTVSDDDLDAFSGALDDGRGSGTVGTFVTQSHNLDRVEISDLGGPTTPSTTEAVRPEVAYAAPTLTEADALGKIDVANEVLGVLARAIELVKGPHRGSGTMQLLVDGRPRAYAPLFEGIRVASAGTLPSHAVLENLRRRPPSEQRRLLNQGMLDLIDRALDKAADELPDPAFDAVLERVMGYRQRLGL
jgi:hypothetical protein